ncbi:copper chaperone PCu(A)C [Xenophilus arseniciresistens]|uniref:Copper chaperone PCu(A)C n=1 Tax=Xenophilus arseniciresistens TaxID=1283306 RepID=A0AAE3T0W5_9BURK|nr:copper chaperone PCu(A)C [Xenophilus arseniciresistens]MDA7417381.1 copper chaperone PCu(A)C [Xenophilus arseniciresistens]
MTSSSACRAARWTAAALLGTLALFGSAQAHDFRVGELSIDHPYATPSLPGVKTGAVYLRGIRNKGSAPDRLIGASTPVAERVELHTRQIDGDVLRMREVPAIALPAGQEVQLRHGQPQHLMLVGLKKPLKVGERFDLTLRFERAGETTVKAWVQQPRAAADDAAHKH